MTNETVPPTGGCPTWPGLCIDTEPGHLDHYNSEHEITDKRGERLFDVTFTQFTDEHGASPAKISIAGMGSEDYDPHEVRQVTAKIRQLLDVADAMADQVLAAEARA
ncbi:hypothetical protein [Streptomyces sp. V3I7]|uniref:hypothetical protein n=1 Tax=Streptomyces sp. V3I7 TaxID=3042278 RepID=UPI0027897BFB|nr:hypothetical protein [Streptomyces sp. V3I7]MDQ0992199.1 hypothetical protein [Streptomyces sp. V3I7]